MFARGLWQNLTQYEVAMIVRERIYKIKANRLSQITFVLPKHQMQPRMQVVLHTRLRP